MAKEIEIVIKGSKEFEDIRGKIVNYELPESINWIGMITSKKQTIRANHYHPVQEQKTLLIHGKYLSIYKDLSEKDGKIQERIIESGDLEIIKPNVAHTMVFLEDSVFINLVNGEREHANFGKHTLAYKLIDEKDIKAYISKYK